MTDEDFDSNLRATVRTLLAWRGRTVDDMATGIGISRSCAYQRLADFTVKGKKMPATEFTAAEVRRLARFFGVHETVFFRDVEELIGGADAHSGAPAIRS